jgi:hypothetical protein
MMEPGYDDDDLIEDYIEDDEGPPPGYDDEYLEEMMGETGEQSGETAAAGASSGATQTQASTSNSERNGASDMIESMMQQDEEEQEDDDEIAETSANVHQAYAKRREGKKNLYTFERYAYVHPHWIYRLFSASLAMPKLTLDAYIILLCFAVSQVQPELRLEERSRWIAQEYNEGQGMESNCI